MINQDYIICLNSLHEVIVLDYLNDVQSIIDDATANDEDYDSFLNVLANIIMKHNKDGEMAYKDTIFRNSWLYNLPSMIYWACLGYVSALINKNEEVGLVAGKLAIRLDEVNDSISKLILYRPNFDDDKTLLN
tara:strand:- start:20502 stop:20900 length:399 start_codon:yes stop_codon:yes gene_type:complete